MNLYAFCGNNGVNKWDLLGQVVVLDPSEFSSNDVGSGGSNEDAIARWERALGGIGDLVIEIQGAYVTGSSGALSGVSAARADLTKLAEVQRILASGRSVTVTDANGKQVQIKPGDGQLFSSGGINVAVGVAVAPNSAGRSGPVDLQPSPG